MALVHCYPEKDEGGAEDAVLSDDKGDVSWETKEAFLTTTMTGPFG